MGVYNVHERRFDVPAEKLGELIDSWSTDHDRLWPSDLWPPTRFDRPLGIGADGGHGPIRYTVTDYTAGRSVRCRFTGPRGVDGFHEFTVHREGDAATLRHILAMNPHGPAKLTWPLVFRWLHDALLEDCLDRAERELTGTVRRPASWSRYVRLLRRIATRLPSATPSGSR
ncbi:MAG: SRPBCC family protein [Pseudonocardiaceae bacterium]|nr:SRPBCC family protein [Pseudonocardiaceae bacterium]